MTLIRHVMFLYLLLAPGYLFSQKIFQLVCNDAVNPVCIDDPHPRFSWVITAERRGETQSAYQVLVASSEAMLAADVADVWNSGKIRSGQSNYIRYSGRPLLSQRSYFWKVRIWNAGGTPSAWSTAATWNMGLLHPSDWKAQWITASKWFTPAAYRPKGFEVGAKGGWADIDLGSEVPVDTIKVFPYEQKSFPAHFVVMGSDEFNFVHYSLLADRRTGDPSFHGNVPGTDLQNNDAPANNDALVFITRHVKCRYIRLQILPDRGKATNIVRQLQVISDGENKALMKFTREYGTDWDHGHAPFLVDGMPSQHDGDICPTDACPSTAAPQFRKTFRIDRAIKKATVYVAALGMADLTVNGGKVGHDVLSPPFTDYYKRIMYVSYDITRSLTEGVNALGVVLGNGFFSTPGLGFGQRHNGFGPPGFILQACIEYTDGSRQWVLSDPSWKWTRSEITFNDIWKGYTEDRHLYKAGWDTPLYNDSDWLPAGNLKATGGKLVARTGPAIRVNDLIKPVRVSGNHAFFETVSTGWPVLKVNGRAGQQVTVTGTGPGYTLSKLTFILANDGPATLSPRFILQPGPTDLQVDGLDAPLSDSDVAIQYINADLQDASAFNCSNAWLNELYEVTMRTHRNFVNDFPSDPDREKQGWTEDAQNMFTTATFFSDMRGVYRRWWMDMADNQDARGYLGSIAPMVNRQVYDWNSPWWSGMIVFLPWRYYQFYGDRSLLEKGYGAMRSYVDFLDRMAKTGEGKNWDDYPYFTQNLDTAAAKKRMIIWNGAGDWFNPYTEGQHAVPTPVTTMTAWYYYATVVSRTAALLGKKQDAARYDKMAARIKESFNALYFHPRTGWYGDSTNNQAAQVLPLAVGMAPKEKEQLVYSRLEDAIHARQDHIGTGFTSTAFLLQILAEQRAAKLANKIINQKDYPGWNTLIKSGVLQENWHGEYAQMPSCGGAVGGWLFQSVLGIQPDPNHPGFKEFILAPQPDEATGLTSAQGHFNSGYGKISIAWRCVGNKFTADLEIPVNTRAKLFVPTDDIQSVTESGSPVKNDPVIRFIGKDNRAAVYLVGSGKYHFESAYLIVGESPAVKHTTATTGGNKPLFRNFMGINGHRSFRPELYGQVCRLVRNYHNIDWDVKALGDPLTIPVTANNINWKTDVYGPWKQKGFETDICLQFGKFGADHLNLMQTWKGKEQWTYDYGKRMASFFGPSGTEKLATSFEIDNEPGKRVDSALYRTIFTQMAGGIRAGDPGALILTPAVQACAADDYSQGLGSIYADKDILPLYDVINIHTYPTLPKSATSENSWNRSYPEDTSLIYLKVVDESIAWRNQHAKGKKVWVTEFGYDACTPEAMLHRKDWALKLNWQGATDLQQAQYIVRSYLAFAIRDVDRAYLYYYNDDDEASFHAASGLTRRFQPKMSFWAVKQLYETLGNYRFRRVVKNEAGKLFVYEFEQGDDKNNKIWVAWSPTGTKTQEKEGYQPRTSTVTLDGLPGRPVRVVGMATTDGPAPEPKWEQTADKTITLTIGESPTFIVMDK